MKFAAYCSATLMSSGLKTLRIANLTAYEYILAFLSSQRGISAVGCRQHNVDRTGGKGGAKLVFPLG